MADPQNADGCLEVTRDEIVGMLDRMNTFIGAVTSVNGRETSHDELQNAYRAHKALMQSVARAVGRFAGQHL